MEPYSVASKMRDGRGTTEC